MQSAEAVVREIMARSWRFGVAVLLKPEPRVANGDLLCSGYFDGDSKVLAVATGRNESDWLGVMLHEYCHLTQWAESQALWHRYDEGMWGWLEGKRVRDPEKAVRSVQALEEDCERRTIRLIQEIEAPVDLERYVRGANAYIHFHNTILETRKWYRPDVSPSDDETILAVANPTFDRDFTKTPKALREALLSCV